MITRVVHCSQGATAPTGRGATLRRTQARVGYPSDSYSSCHPTGGRSYATDSRTIKAQVRNGIGEPWDYHHPPDAR